MGLAQSQTALREPHNAGCLTLFVNSISSLAFGLCLQEWTDDRLIWDPKNFGNLTDIIVTASKLWLPELAVMNG